MIAEIKEKSKIFSMCAQKFMIKLRFKKYIKHFLFKEYEKMQSFSTNFVITFIKLSRILGGIFGKSLSPLLTL